MEGRGFWGGRMRDGEVWPRRVAKFSRGEGVVVFGDEGEAACPPAPWRGLEATGTVPLLEERPVTGTVTPLGGGGSAAFGRRGLGIPCFGDIAACLVDLCGQGPCPVAARADLAGFPPV